MRLRALPLAVLLALGACGYEPLYGQWPSRGGGAPAMMERIVIDPVEIQVDAKERLFSTNTGSERTAQLVRNHLLDHLTPQGKAREPLYRLKIEIDEVRETSIISLNDDATRVSIRMLAKFALHDIKDDTKVIYYNRTRAFTAYNILPADYGNVAAEKDARSRLSIELAQNIRNSLGVFFRRQTTAAQ